MTRQLSPRRDLLASKSLKKRLLARSSRRSGGHGIEALEERLMLSVTAGNAPNVFGLYDGVINANATDKITLPITTDFTLPSKVIVLGFETVAGPGSGLDPAAVQVFGTNGAQVAPITTRTEIGGPGESLTVVQLAPNVTYTVVASGLKGTSGAYELKTFLPGDIGGLRTVSLADLQATNNDYAHQTYHLESDANLDGVISSSDYSAVRFNYTDKTTLNPLPLTESLSGPTVTLPGGGVATSNATVTVSGTTAPNTPVVLDTGDGKFDSGSTTSNGSGLYSMTVKLADGPDTLTVKSRTTTPFVQQRLASTSILVDTQGPSLAITSPADGQSTKTNVTITGTVADAGAGLSAGGLAASLDGGAASPVTFDPKTGGFSLATSLPLDGTADGAHKVTLTATDRVGNPSTAALNFTLQSQTLPLTENLSARTVTLPNGTLATQQNSFNVSGTTAPSTPVSLEVDYFTTDGAASVTLNTTSGDTGAYTFSLPPADLPDGLDTLKVTATTTGTPSKQRSLTATIQIDTQGPELNLGGPANGLVTNANFTITGSAVDAGSGLSAGGLVASLDGGAASPVTFDPKTGGFSLATSLKLDGTADGAHKVTLTATDQVGNPSTAALNFTLDTVAPKFNITSPAANATLTASSSLTGTVDGTGSAVSMVTYQFDNNPTTPVFVTKGSFSQSLGLSGLSNGAHTLTIAATDQAGNSTSQTLNVTTAGVSPFQITSYTPLANSQDVGLTVHPEIFFSKPVDPGTLNANDFYATFGGRKLAANIVPSTDGTYAWLFFTSPMPDSSDIRVTIDGSQIHPMGDATTELDAMGTGMAGSTASFDYYTVSTVKVASATVAGTIADPGPDLSPMTADDYNGATGQVLLPIEHVKVYVIGDETNAVYTDAKGHYQLTVPIGDVKIGIDGTTAVNDPAGYYFPQMAMDTTMKPGTNTIMMGMPVNWLPRLKSAILQTVADSTTTATKITAGADGGAGLTPAQQALLSVTVQPGSLIGADGLPVKQAQIGISVVPSSLVMDMLPAGVLQHSFDITVQGLGVTNFSTPAPMTFPNMFNDPTSPDYAAPGSKLFFLSFDHTTGRLVIEGTATVSQDGTEVITDPGSGVTHPGWHGLVPPGAMPSGPGPNPPPCLSTTQVVETVVDVGVQIAQCAAALTGLGPAVQAIIDGVKNAQAAIEGAIKTYNDIKSGGALSCASITDAVQTINSAKAVGLDIASLLSKDNPASPVNKALNISKCIENLLNVLSNVCGRITSNDSQWNNIVTRTVCLGIDVADTELAKVNALIDKVEATGKQLGLALICQISNQIAKIVGDGCGLNPPPPPGPHTSSVMAMSMASDTPNFTPDQLSQLESLLPQLVSGWQGFVANVQPTKDFLNATAGLGNASLALNDGITQMAYQSIGAANAFYLFQYQDAAGTTISLRGRADANGRVDVVLPPSINYDFYLYDFKNDRIATYHGATGASGSPSTIPYLNFNPTTAVTDVLGNVVTPALPHANKDPLADLAELIVGITTTGTTAAQRVIEDNQVSQGLDPSDVPPPVGILGTVQPVGSGGVQDVVASKNTAYLADGAGGVQVVDITNVSKPVVVASLPSSTLGGDAQSVSFTAIPDTDPNALPGQLTNVVAAALGSNGLAVIDVTDGPSAHLVTNIPVPGGALSVQIVDNLAYVGGHGGLVTIVDMVGDQVVTSFSAAGGGDVSAVKFSGTTLYTLSNGTLASYDVSANLGSPKLLSSLSVPGASKLFVGNKTAYLTGQLTFLAVDVTDPTNMVLASGTFPRQNYNGVAVDGTGSLIAGTSNNFNGVFVASLFDVVNPTDLNSFVTQFTVPGSVQAVWVQNGMALLADGSGGLAIFNYHQTVASANAPVVTLKTSSPDGTTVASGSRLEVNVEATDPDNPIRSVTLTANTQNGVVTQTSGSYPFRFFVDVPNLTSGDDTEALNVTVTDAAGNSTTQQLALKIVPDTTPPLLLSTLPAAGTIEFNAVQSFRMTFTKPLDTMSLTTGSALSAGSIHIIKAGPDGKYGDGTLVPVGTIDFRNSIDMLTVTPASPLGPGSYEVVLDQSMIMDRAGNAMGSGTSTSTVTVQAIPFDAKISGRIARPGQVDLYSFNAPAGSQVTLFANWNPDASGLSDGHIVLIGPDGVTVVGDDQGYGTSEIRNAVLTAGGEYTVEVVAGSANTLEVGTYNFTISDPNPAPIAIAYGQSKGSEIAVRGDNPVWQFQGQAGDLVNLSYAGPAVSSITLKNPDGTVAATLPGGTSSVLYALPVTQAGLYTFVLQDDDATGAYSVHLDQGNFTTTTAGKYDTTQTGSLPLPYAIDEYSYTLHKGDVTTVFADFTAMGGGSLHLIDAATGKDLVAPQTGFQPEISRYNSGADQTVLVEVLGANGSGFHTGSFTLTVANPSQPTQTLALGSEATGTILVRGDDQHWQFTSTAAGQVVTLGYRGPSMGNGVTVTRPNGTTLAVLPAGGTLAARDLVLDQVGTYHFTLSDPNATGAYTLDLSSPSNTLKTPIPLAMNAATAGAISPLFDVENYTIAASSGLPLNVLAEWSPGGTGLGNGEVDVYAPGGALVASASGPLAESAAVLAPVDGTYTVVVRAQSGFDFKTGSFRVTAFQNAKNPTHDTLATATDTAIPPATPTHYQATGFIGDDQYGVADVDIYSVQAKRGDQISSTVAPSAGSDLGTYLRLFDSKGNQLVTSGGFGSKVGSFLAYTVLTDGTYYVGVGSAGNSGYDPQTAGSGSAGSVGGYQLAIDTSRDYSGPTVVSVNPSGSSTREDITTLAISFNKRLLSGTATDPGNYQLISAGADGVFGTADDSTVAVTPSYDDASQKVTLTLASALPQGFAYRLTILGTGASPLTDIAGNPLNNGVDTVKYLQLVSSLPTPASYPFSDGFEAGSFGPAWATSTTGDAHVAVTNKATAHSGTYSAQMSDSGNQGRASLTLSVDLSAVPPSADADLSFWHLGYGRSSMPATFSGRVNADGVAISEDGVNWFRVTDLGVSGDGSYTHYVVDLKGALLTAGFLFPPANPLQIMFQQDLYNGQTAGFDDVRLDTNLAGPTITSVSTPGPLVFSSSLTSIAVDFSKSLQSLGANAVSSYELTNQNGTPVPFTPSYKDAAKEVTLAFSSPLAAGSYTLRVNGNPSTGGTSQIRDTNGNLLNNGSDSVYSFVLVNTESAANDDTGSATATGLTSGGQYSVTTAIGNNANGPRDVDLYRFTAAAGDRFSASTASQQYGAAGLPTLLRLFDANGNQIASNAQANQFTTDSALSGFEIPAAGTYYLGVSSSRNNSYNPLFSPSGIVGPEGEYTLNVALATDLVPPTVTAVTPHTGPNVSQTLNAIRVTFSEPVPASLASDPSNYTLTYLGADGVAGTGDDQSFSFAASYNAKADQTTLTLTGPKALLPLPVGSYVLTVKGTSGHITDLAGNPLGAGHDYVSAFNVIAPESPLNDRIADAYDTGVPSGGGTYTAAGAIGDNAFGPLDVDFYKVQVENGLQLSVGLTDASIGSPLIGHLRLFDASGKELTNSEPYSPADASLTYNVPTDGTYYVGVSGSGNDYYDPFVPGSGSGSAAGEYVLTVTTKDVVPPTVTGISAPQFSVDPKLNHIAVQFNKSMDLSSASAAGNYTLTSSGPDRTFGNADDAAIPFTVSYNPTTHLATLTTASPIPNGDVQLVVRSTNLVDRGGLKLNGGVDQTFTFSQISAGASLPAADGFEAGKFGPNWVATQADKYGLAEVTALGGPRRGAYDLVLGGTNYYYYDNYQPPTGTAVLAVQTSTGSPLNLSFYEKRSANESSFGLPAAFTGNATGDGVSMSTDGQNWYRVVDLTTQTDSNVYDHFTADLAAAATADGLTLGGVLLVRFSNSEYYPYDGTNYGRVFDDVRVAAGPTAPVVTGLTPGTFVTGTSPTGIGVVFSAPLATNAATNTANYKLTLAGPDGLFGDGTPVTVSTASYDAASRTVTLTASAALADGAYQVTVLPAVTDPNGVPVNEGLAQSLAFDATTTEAATNDTLATATSTGIASGANGSYAVTTSIGNNSFAGKDVDFYAVPGVSGERLAAHVSRLGASGADLLVQLFDSNGNVLGSAATGGSAATAATAVLLNAGGTYYVGISSAANTTYSPTTAGSGTAGAPGLYHLTIDANSGIAVPPLNEGFEAATLPGYFTTYVSTPSAAVAQPSTDVAHTGTRSLLLGTEVSTNQYALEEATLTFDATALSHNDLSFYAYVPYYKYYYQLNSLAPAGGSFTGHYNGDGVSLSVDGKTWYPVVDYSAARAAGTLQYSTWTRFTVDLQATAASDGLTLNDHTQIKFQNYGYTYFSSGTFYNYNTYVDDVRLGKDLVGPKVVSTTGSGQFAVSGSLNSVTARFNESLDATSASNAANYQLQKQGPSGQFDAYDAVTYTLKPTYDDSTHTTTLAVQGLTGALPTGVYRLRLIGTGATPLTDTSGNALLDGLNDDFVFGVFPAEATTNDTIATATSTGVTPAGGGYTVSAMLGNNTTDGTASFNDTDLYRIDATAGQLLYFRATSGYGTPDLLLRLFDASGNPVTSFSPTNHNVTADHFAVPSSGTYYLGVSDSSNNAYDPTKGGGTGTTRGFYTLSVQLVNGAAFPFTDGFESGTISPSAWDTFTNGPGSLVASTTAPLDGSYSAAFNVFNTTVSGYSQNDLTLHVNLANLPASTPAELRFVEQSTGYYYNYGSNPVSYGLGRDVGTSGVYLSVDGSNFYRLDPSYFTNYSTSGSVQRSINLSEFAGLNGLTLSADTEIRFSSYTYSYGSQNTQAARQLDDVQVVTDTFGPKVTSVAADNNNTSTTLLNDALTRFTATFDTRLDPTAAASASSYQLIYAGADGKFPGQAGDSGTDNVVIPLSPTYDGNFQVTLGIPAADLRLAPGRYELVFKGTGSSPLTDRYGNVLNGGPGSANGADTATVYTVLASGPRVASSTPAMVNGYPAAVSASTGLSSVSLTFNEAILASSFTGSQVSVTDQAGVVLADPSTVTVAPAQGDTTGTRWVVSFPAVHTPGNISVRVGPGITDTSGVPMNQNDNTVNGENPGDTYAVTVNLSDAANGQYTVNLLDQNRFLYDIYTYYGYLNQGGQLNSGGGQLASPSYSGLSELQVAVNNSNYTSTYTYYNSNYSYNTGAYAFAYTNSGQGVVLPNLAMGPLAVHREVYVPASGGNFARELEVLSNPGATAVNATVTLSGYLGAGSQVVVSSSSDGTGKLDTADTYYVTTGSTLALGHVLMDGKGATVTSSASLSSYGYVTWSIPVTIPAGQTVSVMTLETQQQTVSQANAQVSSLVGLPSGVLDGLTAAQKASILNFAAGQTVAPIVTAVTPDPTSTVIAPVTQFVATFSERLDPTSAGTAGNYTLLYAGPDGTFGTADDQTIGVTPTYNDAKDQVTLAVAAGSSPLAGGLYRLSFLPAITNGAGTGLNGGTAQVFNYTVFRSGPKVNSLTPDNTTTANGWSNVSVTFDQAVAGSSFTADQVQVTDQTGASAVDPSQVTIAPASGDTTGTRWVVSFPAIHAPGIYTVTLGPGITNPAGQPMNQNQNLVNGEPGDAYSASEGVTDTGGTTLSDSQGYQYNIEPYYGVIVSGGKGAVAPTAQVSPSLVGGGGGGAPSLLAPFSYYAYLAVGGTYYADNNYIPATGQDAYQLKDGNQTLVLPNQAINGLLVHREIYVPSGGDGFARVIDVITNPGAQAVSTGVTYYGNLASGANSQVYASSDGTNSVGPNDTYFVTSDTNGSYIPVGHVLADGRAEKPSYAYLYNGQAGWGYDLSVGPGQTVRLMSLETQQGTPAAAKTEASNLAGVSVANELANLTAAEKGSILNFVAGASTLAPFVKNDLTRPLFNNDGPVTALYVSFSKALTPSTVTDPASFSLVGAGPDGLFGTADDVSYPLTTGYYEYASDNPPDSSVSVTLTDSSQGLPTGSYRLTIGGGLTSTDGLAFNGGVSRAYDFQVLHNGPSVNSLSADSTNPETGLSSLSVTFSEAVAGSSFTADQVQVTDQTGASVVDPSQVTIAPASGDTTGTRWVVSFPAIHAPGRYQVKIGPKITDLTGSAMNQNGNAVFGEDPSDAYTTSLTVTDTSGTTLQDGGGFQYQIDPYYGVLNGGGWVDPSTGNLTRTGSYSDYAYFEVGTPSSGTQTYYNSSSAYALAENGRDIILGTQTVGGLQAHREILVPTNDQFVRFLDVITNPGKDAVTAQVTYYGYLGSAETQFVANSNNTGSFDTSEKYIVTDDASDTAGALSLGHVFMDGQAAPMSYSYYSNGGTYLYWSYSVTIGAGQTVRLLSYDTQQLNRSSAITQAQRLVGLPDTAVSDLSAADRASVVNFAVPSGANPSVSVFMTPAAAPPAAAKIQAFDAAIQTLASPTVFSATSTGLDPAALAGLDPNSIDSALADYQTSLSLKRRKSAILVNP